MLVQIESADACVQLQAVLRTPWNLGRRTADQQVVRELVLTNSPMITCAEVGYTAVGIVSTQLSFVQVAAVAKYRRRRAPCEKLADWLGGVDASCLVGGGYFRIVAVG